MAICRYSRLEAYPEDRSTGRQTLSLCTGYIVADLFKLFVLRSQDTWDVCGRPGLLPKSWRLLCSRVTAARRIDWGPSRPAAAVLQCSCRWPGAGSPVFHISLRRPEGSIAFQAEAFLFAARRSSTNATWASIAGCLKPF